MYSYNTEQLILSGNLVAVLLECVKVVGWKKVSAASVSKSVDYSLAGVVIIGHTDQGRSC